MASDWILFNRAIILGRDLGPTIRKGQHSSTVGDRVGDTLERGRLSPMKVNHRSIGYKSKARAAALGLPLDPPPFFFEGEIRLSGSYMNLSCAALGFIVLLAFRLFLPDPARPLPSLSLLLMTSIGAAVFYFGIRFVTYWAIWRKISGNYRQKGGRYLGANGELPKNAFLVVFMAPLAAFGVSVLDLGGPRRSVGTRLVGGDSCCGGHRFPGPEGCLAGSIFGSGQMAQGDSQRSGHSEARCRRLLKCRPRCTGPNRPVSFSRSHGFFLVPLCPRTSLAPPADQ